MKDNEIRIDDVMENLDEFEDVYPVEDEHLVIVPQAKYDKLLVDAGQLAMLKRYIRSGEKNVNTIKTLLGINEVTK